MFSFSLEHVENNQWLIKNGVGYYWCGFHEWVQLGSSYDQHTLDCFASKFTWEELVDFVKDHFEVDLKCI